MDGKMEARQHGARRAAALYRTRAAEGGCGGRMLASTDCTGRALQQSEWIGPYAVEPWWSGLERDRGGGRVEPTANGQWSRGAVDVDPCPEITLPLL